MNNFDVTTNKRSIAGKLEPLIAVMEKMPMEELRSKVLSILEDKDTVASEETRNKWKIIFTKAKNKTQAMYTVTNLYLKAANLGTGND